jgi:uncharacterized YccA/Bax inhibitor family protein
MAKKITRLSYDKSVDLILCKTERMLAVMATISMIVFICLAVFVDMANELKASLIIGGIIMFYMAAKRCIRTEKINGRYR